MNQAIEKVWDAVSFPKKALLEKRVAKKQFLESAELVSRDKRMFQDQVKNVYWQYTLKPLTCPVLTYRDEQREYIEVEVLQVEMNSRKGHKRIAEIIHRAIPYPLLLGFYTESGDLALSIAPKRFRQAGHGNLVVERFDTTDWMSSEALNEQESAFIASLAWEQMPLQTYGTLYQAWVDRFTGYACSLWSGTFTIGKSEERLERLRRCREIETRISELRRQLQQAAFKRQVELNMRIKKLEQELEQLAASL